MADAHKKHKMSTGACLSDGVSLPVFQSPDHLITDSRWHAYLKTLYGPAVQNASLYPIDVSQFWILQKQHLDAAGLHMKVAECPNQDQDAFWNWHFSLVNTVHIHHSAPLRPLPANSWVEVTHCLTAPADISRQERTGYWMFYAPGSGVFYNLGRTKVFQTHSEAVKFFLQQDCGNHYNEPNWCAMFYPGLVREASKNFDSIQFLDHADQACGGRGHEIIDLHHAGVDICSLPIAGSFGNCPCACQALPGYPGPHPGEQNTCLSCQLQCGTE